MDISKEDELQRVYMKAQTNRVCMSLVKQSTQLLRDEGLSGLAKGAYRYSGGMTG